MRWKIWTLLLVSTIIQYTQSQTYKCPINSDCFCENNGHKFALQCWSSDLQNSDFEIFIAEQKNLSIKCQNSLDWSTFLIKMNINLSYISTINFTNCRHPRLSSSNKKRLSNTVKQLRLNNVTTLNFRNYSSNLHQADLTMFPNLIKLHLNDNGMEHITRDSLIGIPNLQVLTFNDDKIKSLESLAFDSLKNLRMVEMIGSQLQTLAYNIFRKLGQLEVVKLSDNNFFALPDNLFQTNINLKVLKVVNNKQNLTTVPSIFFSNSQELTHVEISNCGLFSLPKDLFWGSPKLSELLLDRNYLTNLPSQIFKYSPNIVVMNLGYNSLQILPDLIFESLNSMKKLDLSHNHLTFISEKQFIGLTDLQELNLRHNNIKNIHSDAFSTLRNLKVLKLSNNALILTTEQFASFRPISPFSECQSLQKLDLSHNYINRIFRDWLGAFPNLRDLNLANNNFTRLQAQDLQFVSNNVFVDLRNNEISHVQMEKLELLLVNRKPSADRNIVVNIENNPIKCDCLLYDFLRYILGEMNSFTSSFAEFQIGNMRCDASSNMNGLLITEVDSTKLTCPFSNHDSVAEDACSSTSPCACFFRPWDRALIIDCSGKNLFSGPMWIESNLFDKVELNLEKNSLREVSMMDIDMFSKITLLDFSHNNISSFKLEKLPTNLQEIRLHGNQLTTLDSDFLQILSNSTSLKTLTLFDNPWKCDCTSLDILTFVQRNREIILDIDYTICDKLGIPLLNIPKEDLCAIGTLSYFIICAIVGCIAVITVCLIACCYYQRKNIKVWLYSKNWCMSLISEDYQDDDKLYDAFISYSHKDDDFVFSELLPPLHDARENYKLCVHFRDWAASDFIPARIEQSIQESKRTIIVVTPNFLQSTWSKLEFRNAHKQTFINNRPIIIFIIFGNIGLIDNLDPLLRAYMKMNTYIRWEDPWFWQKLKYALPHCKRIKSSVNGEDETKTYRGEQCVDEICHVDNENNEYISTSIRV